MPQFNGTGPKGKGSQTGRRLGKCSSGTNLIDEQATTQDRPKGLGMGRGRGRGFAKGFRCKGENGQGFGKGTASL